MAQQVPPDDREYDQEIVMREQYQQVMTPAGPVMQSVAVTEQHDRIAAQRARYGWISALIAFIFGILETLILARFVLKLIPANPDNGIVRFVYGVTEPFLAPFLTILPALSFRVGAVIELSALVAFFFYLLLGVGLERLLRLILLRPGSGTTATRVERRG